MAKENSLAEENDLGPITVNSFGERYYFNINRNSFDKVSAHTLFDTRFGKALFNEDALNIVVGTDSGLLPQYVQNKLLPKGTRYIFLEPEQVLQALQSNQMLAGLDEERMVCISLEDWADAIRRFKISDYFYINSVQSFNAICAEDDHIQEYAELSWHIAEVLAQLHWLNTVELGSESFISRQISNVADNTRPAKLLEKAFMDKTVALLAGGPSLDEVLPWVRRHRREIIVFAVSRISRQLLASEIEPDFIFSVDPTELSFDISKEMLNFGRRTTFVCAYHVVPSLLNQWLGLVLYLGDRLPWSSVLNAANLGSPGPTVTNTALNVAYDFGFRQIILAGVDLCFTRDGYTHAKGSNEHLAGPRFNLTSLQVETNDGFMAPTSCDFAQAISSLGMQARHLTSKGCRIINVSATSAKVDGIEYVPLDDICLGEANIDALAVVRTRIPEAENDVQKYQKTLDELKRAEFQIRTVQSLAAKARRINDQMYSEQGLIENYKEKKKLDQIEKKFKRDLRQFSKLVKKFGIRRFLKLTKPFTDEEWTAEEAKQIGNVFYDAYQDGAGKLLGLINGAIDRVTARMEECAENPDFSILIEQCRKDQSYGRVRLWRQKYDSKIIPVEILAVFDEFEGRFTAILNEKNTEHLAGAKRHSSLGFLKKRASLLFKHKKIDELHDLLAGLEKHEEQAAAIPYKHLLDAYIAELNHQPQAALDAYQRIVDSGDVLLQEALSRIAGISIDHEDFQTAGISLHCLSQLNPVYLPFYAELQCLNGDVMAGVSAYNSYIAQFPDDTLVQMKLAMLYAQHQVYDAAEMMLNYILQKKPDLESAVALKNQLELMRNANSMESVKSL